MVIFVKPKDIPSVVNFIAKCFKKIRKFVSDVKAQIQNVTSEITKTGDELEESFHEKIEKLRLEINNEPDFFDLSPKLKIDKKKEKNKK